MALAPSRDSYNRQSLTNGVNDAVKAQLRACFASCTMSCLPAHCFAYVDHRRKRKHDSSSRAIHLYPCETFAPLATQRPTEN
ncbi:uncharacterized protein PG986_009607 [Apiospora aurea]|uniref:Uncharacterized protein n=1 Tax=Apiospora aurea TaxID=335848 RepID=A0ABR1Q857_9PEZI